MEKNKKKILIGSVSGIAAAVLLTGIIVAAVQGSGKAVKVAPVSNMNSGGWSSGSEISDYGTVTTNMNQDIYYDDSLTVKEVYVKAGDTVKIGDRLVAYDTTLATMEKEMKQMEIEGIALNRKNIEAELKQLRGTKAVAKGDATGADPVVKTSATETKAGCKRKCSRDQYSCEGQCGRNRCSRKRRYREEQDNSISAEAEYDCSGRKYGYRNGRIGSGFNGDRWKRDR